jgi:hypothetical protein
MQRAPLLPLCLLVTLASCGGKAETPAPSGTSSGEQADSGPSGSSSSSASSSSSSSAMSEGEDASSSGDAGGTIAYDGEIEVSRDFVDGATQPQCSAFADFFVAGLTGNGKPAPGCQCANALGVALPGPVGTAGTLSLAIAGGAALGTLAPSPVDADGSYDLGANYAYAGSPWPSGAELQLEAMGYAGQVLPFTVTFPTPVDFANLSPDLAVPGAVSVSLSQDFVISWTPEGEPGESVALELTDNEGACQCYALDSAGEITITAAELGTAFPSNGPTAPSMNIARVLTTTATVGNTALTMAGRTSVSGIVSFQP